MPQATLTTWQHKAQRVIKQQPAKAGLLGGLLLVLVVVAVRGLVAGGSTPASALAVGVTAGPQGPVTTDKPRGAATGGSSAPVLAWLDTPPAPLVRNPFYVRYEIFPPEVTKSQTESAGNGFWDEIAKSLTVHVDQEEKKQEMLQAVQSRASELQVASVMLGPSPRALINDKLVGEGDVVANFRVLKIEARRIIVESEGIRLEIQMK